MMAQKRGGEISHVSLDGKEEMVGDSCSLDEEYDRDCALDLINRSLGRLEDEYRTRRQSALWSTLKRHLANDAECGNSQEAAQELDISSGAFRTALHRMRKRFGEILKEEVRKTLIDPLEVDAELRHLLKSFR